MQKSKNPLKKIKVGILTFETKKTIQESSHCLRGFFGSKFVDDNQLHNHNTNSYLYRYPLVQYKFLESKPYIIGVQEGVESLKTVFDSFETINLNSNIYEIDERIMSIKHQEFGLCDHIIFYEFVTPWIALNAKNYTMYKDENEHERINILRKGLIGNILSMSKGLGYTVPSEIKCDIDLIKFDSKYKDTGFVSFQGVFMTNFEIPDYVGLGKGVSKGHGTIRRVEL
ncbi:CRISPR-associated endonuclease Cas6 [Methanosalsum natronophilum]|uniref:CRISPR-associated endonuclease Cas6 n=1 Tax=Methanosalsum natronophilum TaxID=768733 RepID=UPI00216AAEB3|nr:CRISPR-associated endonuclease Cas6 [Methanosalsum natronophilum]MCS3924839.1 hypothetical protein [Methanosalsum natronophilum]